MRFGILQNQLQLVTSENSIIIYLLSSTAIYIVLVAKLSENVLYISCSAIYTAVSC